MSEWSEEAGVLELSAVDSQELLDGLSDAVVTADDRGRVIYVNRAAERLLGWERRELAGRPLSTIVPEKLRPRHWDGFSRYVRTREPHLIGGGPVRVPALRADGDEVEVELTLAAHELVSGHLVFVASLRDLTDRLALERERSYGRYLVAMREISSRLANTEGADPLATAGPVVLGALGETLAWDVGGMWTVDGGWLRPVQGWAAPGWEGVAAELVEQATRLRIGQGLPGRVVASGEPRWITDIARDGNLPRGPLAIRHGLRSCFAFPIVVHGVTTAVVEFFSSTRREAEPDLLLSMASAGSEIGRLIEREEGRRQAAIAREHLVRLAEALQASLLPPHPPVIPGLEVAARYRAAAGEGQVGGDFFDVFPLADGAWAVAIGDASGRGPQAAALTALARYTLRAAAVKSERSSDVLQVLNDVVRRELETAGAIDERFLTVAFLVLHPSPVGMSVQLACAGHPAPFVLRATGEVEEAACQGELVGVFEAVEVGDQELALALGDAIVLYTDGAIESRGPDGPFGEERLREVLRAAQGLPAEEVAGMIEEAVLAYVDDECQDDMAIVVLRLPGSRQATEPEPVASAVEVTSA